jgi:hypothetical protein
MVLFLGFVLNGYPLTWCATYLLSGLNIHLSITMQQSYSLPYFSLHLERQAEKRENTVGTILTFILDICLANQQNVINIQQYTLSLLTTRHLLRGSIQHGKKWIKLKNVSYLSEDSLTVPPETSSVNACFPHPGVILRQQESGTAVNVGTSWRGLSSPPSEDRRGAKAAPSAGWTSMGIPSQSVYLNNN